MNKFREDNTEGYTKDDLRVLSAAYEARLLLQGIDPTDPNMKSICDHIAERLLADFDAAYQHLR